MNTTIKSIETIKQSLANLISKYHPNASNQIFKFIENNPSKIECNAKSEDPAEVLFLWLSFQRAGLSSDINSLVDQLSRNCSNYSAEALIERINCLRKAIELPRKENRFNSLFYNEYKALK